MSDREQLQAFQRKIDVCRKILDETDQAITELLSQEQSDEFLNSFIDRASLFLDTEPYGYDFHLNLTNTKNGNAIHINLGISKLPDSED